MKTCAACHFVFSDDPWDPAAHRAHRDQHMKKFPRAGDKTREALDEMVATAERHQQLAAVSTPSGARVGWKR